MATAIKASTSCGAAGRMARSALAAPARPALLLLGGPGRCCVPLQPLAPRPAPLMRAPQQQKPRAPIARAAESDSAPDALESAVAKVVGAKNAPAVVTIGFITLWYALNVGFNLLNKSIFKYFPFPYTVSTVHVVVGTAYCALAYLIGLKSWSFGRPINAKEWKSIAGPAAMHAIGHVAANISFAAVAISLTHTVKTLEPAFNVLLSRLVLGESTPFPVVMTLVPIMAGVALASAGELSFNWLGFSTAMLSNLTFGFRAVWGKLAMTKTLDSTAVYAYTTLISMLICVPIALVAEGPALAEGARVAIAKVGAARFYGDLFAVGLLYHLYNQFAFNTLGRVSPVSHGVCNVVKRIVIIFSSVFFFSQVLTQQALAGTVVAIFGTYLYTSASQKAKADAKKKEGGPGTAAA